jgi:hypothetical protein
MDFLLMGTSWREKRRLLFYTCEVSFQTELNIRLSTKKGFHIRLVHLRLVKIHSKEDVA